MYTYPNPLNSSLDCFASRQLLVVKKSAVDNTDLAEFVHEEIIRTDKYGNSFYYSLVDGVNPIRDNEHELTILTDVFVGCKMRSPKERVAYMAEIPAL